MKTFFEKYPQFRDHEVFLIGVSYGGVSVPNLAEKILGGMKDFKMNLKGFVVANGITSNTFKLSNNFFFNYGHGLLDDEDYANKGCNKNRLFEKNSNFSRAKKI